MATLDGTSRPIELAPGFRITAPGLKGEATIAGTREATPGRAKFEIAVSPFDLALEAAGFSDVKTIEMQTYPTTLQEEAPLRTPAGDEALALDVPDRGPQYEQIVLAIDEDGVVTWNFPVDQVQPATGGQSVTNNS